MPSLLEVRNLSKRYSSRAGLFGRRQKTVYAVDNVSFTVQPGETLGLVGESGSGKSTLVKCLLYLEEPSEGEIIFNGEPLSAQNSTKLRRHAQIIFQDPYTSLPPRMRVGDIIADPLRIHGITERNVATLMADVGLDPATARNYPHQFSGGQRQRIGIARALAVAPSLLVADEAVSSLDVSVQAQILNLLKDLQKEYGLTYIFVSHDLGVVKYMSHRIAVMHLGEIVEIGPAADVYQQPLHPYTRILLSSVPSLDGSLWQRNRIQAGVTWAPPDPANPPSGCKFHPRCPLARARCREQAPRLAEWRPGQQAACHFALDDFPAPPPRSSV